MMALSGQPDHFSMAAGRAISPASLGEGESAYLADLLRAGQDVAVNGPLVCFSRWLHGLCR